MITPLMHFLCFDTYNSFEDTKMTLNKNLTKQNSSMKHAEESGNLASLQDCSSETIGVLLFGDHPNDTHVDDQSTTSDEINFADLDLLSATPEYGGPYDGWRARRFVQKYRSDRRFKAAHDRDVARMRSQEKGYCFVDIARLPGDQIKLSVTPYSVVTLLEFFRSQIVLDMYFEGKLNATFSLKESDVPGIVHLVPGTSFNTASWLRMANNKDYPTDQFNYAKTLRVGAAHFDAALQEFPELNDSVIVKLVIATIFIGLFIVYPIVDQYLYNNVLYDLIKRTFVECGFEPREGALKALMRGSYTMMKQTTIVAFSLGAFFTARDVGKVSKFGKWLIELVTYPNVMPVLNIFDILCYVVTCVFTVFLLALCELVIVTFRARMDVPVYMLIIITLFMCFDPVEAVTASADASRNSLLITIVVAAVVSLITMASPELGRRLERMLTAEAQVEIDVERGSTHSRDDAPRRVTRTYSYDGYHPRAVTTPGLKPEARRPANGIQLTWRILVEFCTGGFVAGYLMMTLLLWATRTIFDYIARVHMLTIANHHELDPRLPADVWFFNLIARHIRRPFRMVRRYVLRGWDALVAQFLSWRTWVRIEIQLLLFRHGLIPREFLPQDAMREYFARQLENLHQVALPDDPYTIANIGTSVMTFVGSPVFDILSFCTTWANDSVNDNHVPYALRVATLSGVLGRLYERTDPVRRDRMWSMLYSFVFGAQVTAESGLDQEKTVGWAERINRVFREWVRASMQGKAVASALFALVTAVPLLLGGYEECTIKDWITRVRDQLAAMPSLERFVDSSLELTSTVVRMAGYPSLCRNIANLLYPAGPENAYTRAYDTYQALLTGKSCDVASSLITVEKAISSFNMESKKHHKSAAERAHCANRMRQLREISSELEALLRSFRERFHTIVIFIYGESQVGKTTMLNYLTQVLAARLKIEPTLFNLPPTFWDDGLMPFHNFISLDDVGSCDTDQNEPPLDKIRRLANPVNQPINHSEAGKRGLIFHNAKIMFVTANRPNLNASKKVSNPEAGINRINVALQVFKDHDTGEQVETRWLPKARNTRKKAIPDHIKFQRMNIVLDKTQTIKITTAGKQIKFDEWINDFVDEVEGMYNDRIKQFHSASVEDVICPHNLYQNDCPHCAVARAQADPAPEALGEQAVIGAAGAAVGVVYAERIERFGLNHIANWDWSRRCFTTSMCFIVPLITYPFVFTFAWVVVVLLSATGLTIIALTEPYRQASRVSSRLFFQASQGLAYLGKGLAAATAGLIVWRGVQWYRRQLKENLNFESRMDIADNVPETTEEKTAADIKARVIDERAQGVNLFPWAQPVQQSMKASTSGQGSSPADTFFHCDKRIWIVRDKDGRVAMRMVQFQTGVMLLNRHSAELCKNQSKLPMEHPSFVTIDSVRQLKWTKKTVTLDWNTMVAIPGQDLAMVRILSGLGTMDSMLAWLSDNQGNQDVDAHVRLGDFHASVTASVKPMTGIFDGNEWSKVSFVTSLIPSVQGFCGSLVVATGTNTVLGIHCGGSGTTKWWYSILTRTDAEKLLSMLGYVPPAHKPYKKSWESAPDRSGEEHPKAVHNFLTGEPEVVIEGFTTRVPTGKTNFVANPYWAAVRAELKNYPERNFVTPSFKHSNVVMRGLMIASNTKLGEVPIDVHKRALIQFIYRVKDATVSTETRQFPIKLDEALNGVPGHRHHNGVNRQTGGGWPLLGSKTKLFVYDDDDRISLKREALRDLNDVLSNVHDGYISATISHVLMKDEPLSVEKIKDVLGVALPRAFACDNWVFYLVCSMYLEPVMGVMLDNPGIFCHCLAIDPLGNEWEQYVGRYDHTDKDRHMPADYSAYDWNHEEKSAEFVANLFAFVSTYHLSYDKVSSSIVYRLVWECCHRSCNFNGTVASAWYFWTSGNKITALAGALKNAYWFSCAFTQLNPTLPVWDHLVFSALGDDCWPALVEGSDANWKPDDIVSTFEEYGFKITPETKDGSVRFIPRNEVVMLRRTTRFNPELGYRVGALDKRSIMRPFELWEDTANPHVKLNEIASSALREMVAYGEDEFNDFASVISRVMSGNNVPVHDLDHFSYEYQVQSIKSANECRTQRNFGLRAESGTIEVDSGETETIENVHVEAPEVEAENWVFKDGTILSDTHEHRTMPPVVHREVLVAKQILPLDQYLITSFQPGTSLFNNAVIRERLEHHHAGSFSVRVRITVAASRFHSGRLRLWYSYAPHILDRWGDDVADYAFRGIWSASRQHVDVEIAEQAAAELVIPFFDPRGKMYFSAASLRDYVTIHIDTLAPMRHMADPAEAPTMAIYASFVDMNVVGNAGARFQATVQSPDEATARRPSVLLGRVGHVADAVGNFPPLAVPAQVVSRMAGTMSSMAKLFGMSRPLTGGGTPYVPVSASSFPNSNHSHVANALAFDCQHGVSLDSRLGSIEADIMSYAHFSDICAPYWFGVIQPGDPLETPFFTTPVTPMIAVRRANLEVPLPCAIPAMVNNFWKCTMVYHVIFTCPMPIGGRVRAIYDAADGTNASHTINDTWLLDLKVSKELRIEIQMCQPDNFLRTGEVFTTEGDQWLPDCHNGTLMLQMETPLTSTQAGFNVDVRVDACCVEFCYGSPDYSSFDNYTLSIYENPPPVVDNSVFNYLYTGNAPGGATAAPTPGLGPESSGAPSRAPVLAPTAAPSFAATAAPSRATTIAPSFSPTNSPSLRGTSFPAFVAENVPVELWGNGENGKVQLNGTVRSGGSSMSITTFSANSLILTITDTVVTGPDVRNVSTGTRYEMSLGNTFGTINATYDQAGGSVTRVIANIPGATRYITVDANRLAALYGGVVVSEDGFETVRNLNSMNITPDDISAHWPTNAIGLVLKGEVDVTVGTTIVPLTSDAFRSWSFDVPTGQSVTITGRGNAPYYVAGAAWLGERLRREAGVEDNETHVFRIENPQHNEVDLMKVHVGEWNHSLRTHVKVPMLARTIVGGTAPEIRPIYDTTSVELSPWSLVFTMYGGYRGGVVRTLEAVENVRRVYIARVKPGDVANRRYRGREILQPELNAVLTTHIPFFSRFRFLYGRNSQLHYGDNYIEYDVVRSDTNAPARLNEYHCVGEDFSPVYFLGPPLLVRR